MGLLQDNKSRRKISNDPNNTKWTRDTTTFGQKILRSQGWQPGQFLGAQDAPHAELHSAASASYIRVVLKDDMKGLGFNKAREDEVTGLDVFSDLLSRLNGKSESAVREDQDARLAVKTHRYVEMRWGPMRFVRGGLLVGDTLQEDGSAESEAGEDEKTKTKRTEGQKGKKDKKSKKRKVEEEDEEEEQELDSEAARNKDKKRRRKEGDEDDAAEKKKRKKENKETKKSKNVNKSKIESDDSNDNELDEKAAKKKAKKEKKEKKKEKREKKEEKKRRKAAKAAAAIADAPNSSSSSSSDDDDDDKDDTDASTSTTPVTAGSSGTATPLGHRTFVRSRYIAQKRQAVMDAKALAQIFMIKA